MRYFRSTPDVYERTRTTLDALLGHPTTDNKTVTCVDPVSLAPADKNGRVMLAVADPLLQIAQVAAVLPSLLESGEVEEISAETYWSVVSRPLSGQ